jgi:hypothetical protein
MSMVELFGDETFAVAVDVEVDATGGDDADEVGAETFEQCAAAFGTVDGSENLKGFGEMMDGGTRGVSCDGRLSFACSSDLGLVEVGLESGLEDVERSGHGSSGHTTNPGKVSMIWSPNRRA